MLELRDLGDIAPEREAIESPARQVWVADWPGLTPDLS